MGLLAFERLAGMPSLSWCVYLSPKHRGAQLWAGERLEIRGERFLEGAWSGDFGAADCFSARTFTGSGGQAESAGVKLACPTHTLSPIYYARYADGVYCANSLEILLAFASDELLPDYPYYDLDLMTVMFGLRRYQRRIPSKQSLTGICRSFHANLLIDRDGRWTEYKKPLPPSFRSFDDYARFLRTEIEAIARNAAHPARRFTYKLLTTVSSGYDSSCASALAESVGCRDSITLASLPDGSTSDDSGEPVARALGMTVASYDPASYRSRVDLPEVEFVSTGLGADDVPFISIEGRLPGRLLLTGFHGDKIWGRDASFAGPWIERGDPSGGSMENFRQRLGFLHLPVPFVGCTRHREIYSISVSDEMGPWSLAGTDYDRPIPRRIVEQSGVPRALFGQRKRVVALPYQTTSGQNPSVERFLSPTSLLSFRDFLAATPPTWKSRVSSHRRLQRVYEMNARLISSPKLVKFGRRFGVRVPHYPLVPWRYSRALGEHSDIFRWAMHISLSRLRRDLGI